MNLLLLLIAEINQNTVPGSVIIPTWILISAIIALSGAISTLFWVLVRGYRKNIKFLESELKHKREECGKLGRLLDQRYKDIKKIASEATSAMDIAKFIMDNLRR